MGNTWNCLLVIFLGLGTAGVPAGVLDPYGGGNSPPSSLGGDSCVNLETNREGIWVADVGEGFRAGTREAGFAAGAGLGLRITATRQRHDLALGAAHFGWMLGEVTGRDHWFRGNWELLVEAFGGAQFEPSNNYVAGIAPVLRYNFATGSRWIPFVDAGAGLTATDIRSPDLSTTFEFNLQGGAGVNYFWRRNSAITFQYRFIHISNASLKTPNLGVNTSMIFAGVSWFF